MARPFGYTEFLYLLTAAQWTIALSAIAFAGGSVGGLIIALARVSGIRVLELAMAGIIRVFQGTPLLMQLFLVFFGLGLLGFQISPWTAAAAGLTLHASAFLGEIWRGCIQAVPKGQTEAAFSLGLGYIDRMRDIVLPQAFKIALGPTTGFLVQLIKGTSLAAIIGFLELTRAGQVITNVTFQPFAVFSVVGLLYFAMCWPLSLLAGRLEARQKAAYR
jgi:polar amino acid transport system permease protein